MRPVASVVHLGGNVASRAWRGEGCLVKVLRGLIQVARVSVIHDRSLPLLETSLHPGGKCLSLIRDYLPYNPGRIFFCSRHQSRMVCPDFLFGIATCFAFPANTMCGPVSNPLSLTSNTSTHPHGLVSQTVRIHVTYHQVSWNSNTEPEPVHLPNMYACKSQAD